MGNEVLEQIIKIKDAVPKKQRILCNYLALNYEKIGVMTVAELAENAGVGSTARSSTFMMHFINTRMKSPIF